MRIQGSMFALARDVFGRLGVLVCGMGLATAAAQQLQPELVSDGRCLKVNLPGLGVAETTWSAEIEQGGVGRMLESAQAAGPATPEPCGDGGQTLVLAYPGVDLLLRWGVARGGKSLWLCNGVRNRGSAPLRVVSLSPVSAVIKPAGSLEDWLLSGLHPKTPLILPAAQLSGVGRIHEYGMCYRNDGAGFVFGPVGEPVTWVDFDWSCNEDRTLRFQAVEAMDRVRLEPGETRWGQAVAWVVDKPQQALGIWADEVARSHHARNRFGALTGWNNWNYLEKKDVHAELRELTRAVMESDQRLRPGVIQMDYNITDPELKTTLQDPDLAEKVRRVAEAGARFGVAITSSVGGWGGISDHLQMLDVVQQVRRAGFLYVKMFNPERVAQAGETSTRFESYRRMLAEIRAAAGEEIYLMYCDYMPNRAAVGYVDSSRVGPDAERRNLQRVIPSVLRSFPLNHRWFVTDPDSYFIGTDIANISQVDGSWPLVRTWMSLVGMNCGMAITSDPWYWEDFKPFWRNVEVLTPPAAERTEVLDMGVCQEWARLVGHVRRPWGESVVALLWNGKSTEQSVTLDFSKAGMKKGRRYAVWSFWDDRYLGVAEDSWTSVKLGPNASQHVVFTELDEVDERPVLIGSNLHIYCGAAEVKQVESSRDRFAVCFNDVGARSGDVFLYSRWQPVFDGARGCEIGAITSAGENVWRVSLLRRMPGERQELRLRVLLPVTRQGWFWGLVAAAVGGLLFGAWRYVVGMRLQRARELDQERARIARDIHDDLGAGLTHLALLGELAQSHASRPDQLERHVDDLFRASQKLARSVDEIVWALNPSNDTVAKFVAYVGDFAQDYLEAAGIRCRLAYADGLPEFSLPPKVRHGMFLVVKECLHNIVSHAGATEVIVEAGCRQKRLTVTISDDGCGFDPEQPRLGRPGGGHGLGNIHQRMAELGGTLELRSASGKGTMIHMEVPL